MDHRQFCCCILSFFNCFHNYIKEKVKERYGPILVGGSGERKTLKIVAKYADECNLFGSPETVRKKLGVLKEYCKSVGRYYDCILKTKLAAIIVDDNSDMVKNKVREAFRGVPEEQIKQFVIYGTPEDVSRQIPCLKRLVSNIS